MNYSTSTSINMQQTISTALRPVSSGERIQALDITRGIALLGILLLNITGFGLGPSAYWNPAVAGGDSGLNLLVFEINSLLFEGTMRGLFSMLFGVGMILLTDRLLKKEAGIRVADIYIRRTVWLIIFGVIHAYILLWWGEVLYAYGVMGLLLFAFRTARPSVLLVIALLLIHVDIGRSIYDYRETLGNEVFYDKFQAMSEEEQKDADEKVVEGNSAWEGILKGPKKAGERYEKYSEETQQGYFSIVASFSSLNHTIQTALYDWGIYDILSMMLIGIAFYKTGIITAERSNRFYLVMILVGYPIGLAVNYYEYQILVNGEFLPLPFQRSMLTYHYGRIFMMLGHIGMIMIFCKSSIMGWLKTSLAAVGRMALTNYVMHSIICAFLFYGFGFGLFGELQRYELYYVVGGIWLFQLVTSPLWLSYFRFGPLEWLWRSLTYNKWQPMKKHATIESPLQPSGL